MKKEHRKYIDEHMRTRSVERIAKELNVKEEVIRSYLRGRKTEGGARPAEPAGTQAGQQKAAPRASASFAALAAILVIVCAVYANSVKGPFLFDDVVLVKDNPLVKSLSNVPAFFTTDIFAHDASSKPLSSSYRPLQALAYAIDFAVWGNDPKGFHAGNIIIHLINVALVFLLMRKLFDNLFIACGVSCVFGVHPVNTQCVSYIAGRADLLVAAFMLLSLLFYIDFSGSAQGTPQRPAPALRSLVLSAIAYAFALYSKEVSMLVVPGILILYNATFNRKGLYAIRSYIFHAAALIAYYPCRLHALRGVPTQMFELSKVALFPRLLTSLKTLFIDLRILLVPYDLHFGRTTELERSLASPYALLTVCGIALVIYILFRSYRRLRGLHDTEGALTFFGLSWFLISMAPLVNIVPLQVFHSDNWLYFSSIGIYLVAARAAYVLWRRCARRGSWNAVAIAALLSIPLAFYGIATVKRNRDYQDEIRFYLSSVKWRPNVKFYRVLGALYGERREYDKAIRYLEKAIETNRTHPSPEVVAAYYNLGITYMHAADYRKAAEAFERVLASGDEGLKSEAERCLAYIRTRP